MTGITPLSPTAHRDLRYNRHAAGAARRFTRLGLSEIAVAAADMPLCLVKDGQTGRFDLVALMSLVEMPGFGALPVPPRRPGSRATAPEATRTVEAATGAGAAPRVRPATPAPADAAAAVPVSAGSADPMAALIATVGAEGGGGGR